MYTVGLETCQTDPPAVCQVEAYLSKLDQLVAALAVSHPGAHYDRRNLGQLYGQLEQLMEDALGVQVRRCTRV